MGAFAKFVENLRIFLTFFRFYAIICNKKATKKASVTSTSSFDPIGAPPQYPIALRLLSLTLYHSWSQLSTKKGYYRSKMEVSIEASLFCCS